LPLFAFWDSFAIFIFWDTLTHSLFVRLFCHLSLSEILLSIFHFLRYFCLFCFLRPVRSICSCSENAGPNCGLCDELGTWLPGLREITQIRTATDFCLSASKIEAGSRIWTTSVSHRSKPRRPTRAALWTGLFLFTATPVFLSGRNTIIWMQTRGIRTSAEDRQCYKLIKSMGMRESFVPTGRDDWWPVRIHLNWYHTVCIYFRRRCYGGAALSLDISVLWLGWDSCCCTPNSQKHVWVIFYLVYHEVFVSSKADRNCLCSAETCFRLLTSFSLRTSWIMLDFSKKTERCDKIVLYANFFGPGRGIK
jgi:hypothetical protein